MERKVNGLSHSVVEKNKSSEEFEKDQKWVVMSAPTRTVCRLPLAFFLQKEKSMGMEVKNGGLGWLVGLVHFSPFFSQELVRWCESSEREGSGVGGARRLSLSLCVIMNDDSK